MEVAKAVVGKDSPLEKYTFEILLRDKYPFQAPLVMTRSNFAKPTLADGRDLLLHLLPEGQQEWTPSTVVP